MGSTTLRLSVPFHCNTATPRKEQSIKTNMLTNCFRPRQHSGLRYTTLCYSRRRRESAAGSTTPKKFSKKKPNVEEEDGDIDEDAFEALFRQLEEDLKNDELFGDEGGDDEISEEELAKLEQELAEALEDDDELLGMFESIAHGGNADEEKEDVDGLGENEDGDQDDYNDDEEEQPLNLKNWQIRRLAYALKIGRRKTNIKNLAAELCLDRAVVLNILRDPPPKLVMLSASLPDKPVETLSDPVKNNTEIDTMDTNSESTNTEVEVKLPVHVMQSNWSARKRLKKVQVETLEEVYRRTKRPTNAMISSIVHVTNLPRKRVVKWFEDKRAEDGVPEQRRPYNRSASDSVFTN